MTGAGTAELDQRGSASTTTERGIETWSRETPPDRALDPIAVSIRVRNTVSGHTGFPVNTDERTKTGR